MQVSRTQLEHIIMAAVDPERLTLECDGMTRVIHTILTWADIEHHVMFGSLKRQKTGLTVIPVHFWIVAGGLTANFIIDYCAKMWVGPDAPHGIFGQDWSNAGWTYHGWRQVPDPLPEAIFNHLIQANTRSPEVR